MVTHEQKSPSLRSKMQLIFARENDKTIIKERFHEGLFHFSKHYREDDYIMLQLVNPTAGIFSNDHMQSSIILEEGAKVIIASPSSTQLYTMPDNGQAHSEQTIRIANDACLEFTPQWLVPHKESSYKQQTTVHLEKNASMFFVELLSPGRQAFGECMKFRELSLTFKLYLNNRIVALEHLHMSKDADRNMWSIPNWESTYWANIWIAGNKLSPSLVELENINALFKDSKNEVVVGCSRIHEGIDSIRIAAKNTIIMKKSIQKIRKEFLNYLPLIKNNRINT